MECLLFYSECCLFTEFIPESFPLELKKQFPGRIQAVNNLSNQSAATKVYHQNSSDSRLRIGLHTAGSRKILEQFQINARTWWNKIGIDQKRNSFKIPGKNDFHSGNFNSFEAWFWFVIFQGFI